jgi:hypothetical protein
MMEMINSYWQVAQAHWTLVFLGFGVSAFIGLIVWFQFSKAKTRYDFIDVLMDFSGHTPRASLDNHITLFMALLAAWYIVVKTLYPAAGNVGADLVQILLVFLVYRLGRQGVQAWTNKPQAPPAPPQPGGNMQINAPNADTVNVPPQMAAEASSEVGATVTPRKGRLPSAVKTA